MIRPFDWRDFGLIRRLSERGVCFDSEAALTRGPHTLQSAVLSFLAPGAGLPTFIWRNEEDNSVEGFGQIQFRHGDELARLVFMAPAFGEESPWEILLERLTAEAASHGAHNLVAEVNEDSAEFESMRRFGFAIYTRQHIWRAGKPRGTTAPLDGIRLRPQQSSDSFGIQSLYANIVPRLVQQVEPPPARYGHGYVYAPRGEIEAFFDVSRGPLGVWVQPYLHPSIFDDSAALFADLLRQFTDRETVPVYVCVRSHQDWLRTPLANLGFEDWAEQAVMVKRLAVRVSEPEFNPLQVIVGSKATTPMIKSNSGTNTRPLI
ncbi:MAG: hypothetical protein HYZ49_08390 [Chloroflexi bacterium]|nr:hypothetical protein [Chloroflexota bacterium]